MCIILCDEQIFILGKQIQMWLAVFATHEQLFFFKLFPQTLDDLKGFSKGGIQNNLYLDAEHRKKPLCQYFWEKVCKTENTSPIENIRKQKMN